MKPRPALRPSWLAIQPHTITVDPDELEAP